ncbi:hypothetical protein HDV01_003231 [Terramyces sp. JEL0728]|nr:hypothetical protein HDV01_003231 [Terramyces sp. JEL0728]
MTVEFVNLKVQSHVFKISIELFNQIPRSSPLRNILDPDSKFQQEKDSNGNIPLLNKEITFKAVQVLLDYLQYNSVAGLLISSASQRKEVVQAFEYFCIDLPDGFYYNQSIKDSITNGDRIRKDNYQKFLKIQEDEFDKTVLLFFPFAKSISSELVGYLRSKFNLETKPNNNKYGEGSISFKLQVSFRNVSVSLDFKGIEVAAEQQVNFSLENQPNVLGALGYTILCVLWGLVYSKEQCRSKCSYSSVTTWIEMEQLLSAI